MFRNIGSNTPGWWKEKWRITSFFLKFLIAIWYLFIFSEKKLINLHAYSGINKVKLRDTTFWTIRVRNEKRGRTSKLIIRTVCGVGFRHTHFLNKPQISSEKDIDIIMVVEPNKLDNIILMDKFSDSSGPLCLLSKYYQFIDSR